VAVYALGDRVPDIDPSAYVHPDATVIGAVTIGPESTVWPQAVLRGDTGEISVGARTSIQDGTVVHCTEVHHTVIGDDCVIGHLAHLEGCTIKNGALVGSGSIVLHGAVVHEQGLVGANALVGNGKEVPVRGLALGIPATIKENGSNTLEIEIAAAHYVENGKLFREQLRRID
jgi:carbonic anhydrase/acetyltransferase-like protein (isoleucine patch superfamily)